MQSKSVVSLDFPRAAVRHHSGDTGGDAHMRVSHQVDVTDAGWQLQPTYFGVRLRTRQRLAGRPHLPPLPRAIT